MPCPNAHAANEPTKASTGILGFDQLTGGGLPHGRATLVLGGPGSGKTIFGLQFLVHGATDGGEPGIFLAFEETAQRIAANAKSFGWQLDELLDAGKLFLLDAQPIPDLILSGDFDLGATLAVLEAQVQKMGARRIVFDALDIVLALLPDEMARRREIYRLHGWLLAHELTGLITAKLGTGGNHPMSQEPFGFMQYMVDCSVILNQNMVQGVSQRNLRVQKYRGSGFDENESPFLISKDGIQLAVEHPEDRIDTNVTNERLTAGVERLDTMLGGGYYRGANVLITGSPGTAKTTLSGAFAEAACRRGERTMFVSFDSDVGEMVRNLGSVNIHLQPYIDDGSLSVISARTITGSAETYLLRIKTLAREHGTCNLVIDPVSAIFKSGNALTAHGVVERLVNWSKANGITLLWTSLVEESEGPMEGVDAPMQISTLADTWIHLSYLVQAGERNRRMSIIKSRGTAHSNQVRELILSESGVTLADAYTAGGEVLMGTLRWEKENEGRIAGDLAEVAARLRRVKLDAEEAEIEVRLKSLQTELTAKQVEQELLVRTDASRDQAKAQGRSHMQELRGSDENDFAPAKYTRHG